MLTDSRKAGVQESVQRDREERQADLSCNAPLL